MVFVGKCVMDENCRLATTHSMQASSNISTGTHSELNQGTEEKFMFHSTFIIFSLQQRRNRKLAPVFQSK